MHRQQRVAAEFEEVVVAADALHMQQLPPDRGQCFFFCTPRRFVFGAGVCVVRRLGQCAPVQLAVRRQRPRVQPHVRRRHHVARQVLRGLRSQCRDIGVTRVVRDEAFLGRRRSLGRGCIRSCVFRRVIAHLRCRIARKHDHLAHPRHLRQLRLDLPQLDPETAYLHLEVVSTQIFQPSVRAPTRQIPRLIQPPTRHERIVDEPLPRQLRPVQVPPRHLHATDIQLPRHTDRRRTQPRIQHINPRIRNWTPNDIRIVVSPPNLVHRHADRGFRRPVRVEKARPTAFLGKPCIERRRTDRFAADHHAAYAGRDRPTPTQGELAKKLRGQIDDTDPLRPAQRPERLGIRQPPIGPQHERRAASQRREDLLDRSIESDVGKLQHTIGCIEFEILGQRTDLIDHARVLDHHALRRPRRSRRVDHVRKAPRTDVWLVRSA
ncbi:Uncharacterised protein [Burkholderia pseudomallei]|nr:Uncharacterised protein [Burkholderia pseudomallei]